MKSFKDLMEQQLNEMLSDSAQVEMQNQVDKHVAKYKKLGGEEHFGNRLRATAENLAKRHGVKPEVMHKHVQEYAQRLQDMCESVTISPGFNDDWYLIHKKTGLLHPSSIGSKSATASDLRYYPQDEHGKTHYNDNYYAVKGMKAKFMNLKKEVKESFDSTGQLDKMNDIEKEQQDIYDAQKLAFSKDQKKNAALKAKPVDESEEINELSKWKLGDYIKHAVVDAKYHSRMQQFKNPHYEKMAVRRTKGINKAVNKLMAKESEGQTHMSFKDYITELSKQTLINYVVKADRDNIKKTTQASDFLNASHDAKPPFKSHFEKKGYGLQNKVFNRHRNIGRAMQKLTKESILDLQISEFESLVENFDYLDEENQNTLMSFIEENSPFDWKNYKSNINWHDNVKHTSTGIIHKARDTERNSEAEGETEKRGRGRPKGKYNGQYKPRDPAQKAATAAKVMASKAAALARRKAEAANQS